MKKFLVFVAIAIAAVACKKEEPIVPEVKLTSEATVTLPTVDANATVTFTTNVAWKAALKEASDWLAVSPPSGEAGSGTVKLMANDNATNENRTAVLVITAETASVEVTITQLQKDALVLSGEKSYEIPAEGGSVEIEVGHNIPVEVSANVDWVTTTKAMETTKFTLVVAPNTDLAAREAKVTVAGGEFSEEIIITQAGFVPAFAIEPVENMIVDVNGGTKTYKVTANCEYTFGPDADWVTMTDNGDGTYTFSVAGGYNEPSNRTCYVWLNIGYDAVGGEDGGPDGTNDYTYFTITQTGTAKTAWAKNLTSDYSGVTLGLTARLAYKDDMILLATETQVHAINAVDGSYIQSVALPEGFTPHSLVNDNAGNVLVAARAAYVAKENETDPDPVQPDFVVYKVSSLSDISTPTPIASYNVGNIWGAVIGNLRVNGDVNGDAVIAAFCGTTNYAVLWEVKGGVVADPKAVALPQRNIWQPENGFVMPLGTTLADGLMYNGYGGNYSYAYCADASVAEPTFTEVFPGFSTWELGPSAASVVEMGGKKYMACFEHTFFPGWAIASKFYVLDITAPTTPAYYYIGHGILSGQDIAGAAYAGDIMMRAGNNALELYIVDDAQGWLEKVTIPVK